VPYSGSTGAKIVTLEPGRTVVELPDRRRVRNHLRSVHAVALANVGELASGIAMLTALPRNVRGIVVRMEVEFTKKARGTVWASSRVDVPEVRSALEHPVSAEIRDGNDERVARVRVVWRLAPREGS
jgi:acyl-coenzyme A thioesterase PaaI-like protein